MDCSPAAWPSFDDSAWMGTSEISPFDGLEQSNITDYADSKPSSPASVSTECEQYLELIDAMHASNVQNLSPAYLELNEKSEVPNMLQAGALVTWRWDSMNATDLASIFDSTYSCQSVSSITTDDEEYTMYDGELLMDPDRILNGDFGIFTPDPICDSSSVITCSASNAGVLNDVSMAGKDFACVSSLQEQGTVTDIKPLSVGDMKTAEGSSTLHEEQDEVAIQRKLYSSLPSALHSQLQDFRVSPSSITNHDGVEEKRKVPDSNLQSSPDEGKSCDGGDTSHSFFTSPESNTANATKSIEQGNHLCLGTRKVEEGKGSVANTCRKTCVSRQICSQKRIKRAQANRARRHAAGERHAAGRARKCALRKLMQMTSTSSDRTFYKSSQNSGTYTPLLQTSGCMALQSLIGLPRSQPVQTNDMNQQLTHSIVQKPTLLPLVVSAPTLTPIQGHNSNPFVGGTSLQFDPKFDPNLAHERQQLLHCKVPTESHVRSSTEVPVNTVLRAPITALRHDDQGLCLSSESSLAHLPLDEQVIQSLQKVPVVRYQNTLSEVRAGKGSESASAAESMEAMILQQLENVLTKLNIQTRLSIRDSLYRLARSAKRRQYEAESGSTSNISNAVETETNSLDRWIANLLFCKQPSGWKSQGCPPTPSEATCQALYHLPNANGNAHHWNACVNTQEVMPCTY